jgi:hypothetical protein
VGEIILRVPFGQEDTLHMMMVARASTLSGHFPLPPKNLSSMLFMRMMEWVALGMLKNDIVKDKLCSQNI